MVYGYIRVSTDKQDCDNQKIGIEGKAAALGLRIEKYISDAGISGLKEPEKRALGGCLRQLNAGDVIICSELSRLGRRLFMIMRILEHCMQCGAKLYTVKDDYELGDNIQSKVLVFAFGLSAEIERNLISMRTREGLAHRRARGLPVGRGVGVCNRVHKLDGRVDVVREMLARGMSQRAVARQFRVSPPTISRLVARWVGV